MLTQLLAYTVLLVIITYLSGVGRVVFYEHRIKRLLKEMKMRIEELNKRGLDPDFLSTQLIYLRKRYELKIAWLELNRRYLLEKLPFFQG